jgi:hypothetical protein
MTLSPSNHPTGIKTGDSVLAQQHQAWREARARLGKPVAQVRQVPVRLPKMKEEEAVEPAYGAPIDFYAPPSMKFILRAIALKYGMSEKEILRSNRSFRVMPVRHEAIFMVHTHTLRSFPDIGIFFARRDHTTIMHSAATFLKKNPDKAWLREACDATKAAMSADKDRAIKDMLARGYSKTQISRGLGVWFERVVDIESAWLACGGRRNIFGPEAREA